MKNSQDTKTRVDTDASTRAQVLGTILRNGPQTATELAERLSLTPAAVRRHLNVLIENGRLESSPQRVYGQRGRGRPASVFSLTDLGRSEFNQAYDKLAISALKYVRKLGGDKALEDFAAQLTDEVVERYGEIKDDYSTPVAALAAAMSDEGFLASLYTRESGVQICQYHCPVEHVAREFPEICEIESRVFSKLLGTHVTRIASIAHGDGVCNLHVPKPVKRTGVNKKGKQ
ncbi:MAG: transcriptional regulator [Propionibacteriaceae bacterium]|nr:transcriptional regulator [Propionibacteriaceae bacterium]